MRAAPNPNRFRRGRLICVIAGLCIASMTGCRSSHQVLTISVAASLQDAIAEVEAAYRQQHAAVEFRNNFGSSGTLAREIEEGAPVDVFVSAGVRPMNQIESEGMLLPDTRRNLLRNSLVLIAPRGSTLQGFDQLTDNRVRLIALGDPASVPAGQYGKQTLDAFHLYDKLRPKIVLGKDVRQVLTYIETGNADAGLVYATDAQLSDQVRVVAVAPEEAHDPIVYPLAVIKGSHNIEAVRAFVGFLNSPAAHAIFERHGFKPA